MASADTAESRSVDIDSLRPLLCQIDSTVEISGHTEYLVRLSVPHIEQATWTINKRYNDFAALHATISLFNSAIELPPKRTFGNKEREFVAERQQALKNYLDSVLRDLFLSSSKEIKKFIHTGPRIRDAAGSAVQFLSMVFRTDTRFEIMDALPGIGWRVNKEFAVVKSLAEPKRKLVGCWTFYGPDRVLPSGEISALVQSFTQIKHPLFFPLVFADARDTGCASIRMLQPQGSLWDAIKSNKVSQRFLQKNAKNKPGRHLSVEDIQRFGRQILEALKFFHDNAIPYGNLSSRNLFVDKDRVHVSDVESGVCGLRSFYWPFVLQQRKINNFEAIDVYCFGHVLYEMAFGRSCETSTCDSISPDCPPLVRAVLESILTPEAARGGMPTVSQLLTQPLFSNVVLNLEPVSMKISRKLKEALVSAKEKMEARIVNEQKLYHNYVKNQKAFSLQSSEDERKKRRMQALKTQTPSLDVAGDAAIVNARTPTPTAVAEDLPAMAPKVAVSQPPPPPPPPPMFPGTGGLAVTPQKTASELPKTERNALLESIRSFRKNDLAPAETVDKSGPFLPGEAV